jgi:tetratricopeptide (TPR) repeat protein
MGIQALLMLMVLPLVQQADGALDRAIGLYETGKYRDAADMLLAQAADSSGDSAPARFWLGKSYLKIRKWDEAVRNLEKAVKMEPANAQYHLWLGRAYGARAENRIIGYNDARRLLKEFRKARDLAPDDIDIRFDLLEYYAQAPGIVGGDKNKAVAEAEAIAELKPAKGYTARATIHERNKEWEKAEEELTRATQEFPADAAARKDLAQFLFDRGKYEEALASVRKALELNPLSKRARLIGAASRIELKTDLDSAQKALEELAAGPVKDEDPAYEEVYYWLGVCYFKNGRNEEARAALESALSYNPDYRKAKDYISKLK